MTDTLVTVPARGSAPDKLEGGKRLTMHTDYAPAGDQPRHRRTFRRHPVG